MRSVNHKLVLPYANREIQSPYLKSATSEGLSLRKNGAPTEAWANLYGELAQHRELGVIITGHIAVSREGRPEPFCCYLDNGDSCGMAKFINYKKAIQAVKKANPGAIFLAQINHCGRQLSKIQKFRNNSINVFSENQDAVSGAFRVFARPNASVRQKSYPLTQFKAAAQLLIDLGFDGVQFHVAHGYLLCELAEAEHFSQILQLLKDIRGSRPNAVLSIKTNIGPHLLELIKMTEQYVDLFELSKGSYNDPRAMAENWEHPSYQYYLQEIFPNLGSQFYPIICATGGYVSLKQADETLFDRKIPMVGMARLYCQKGVNHVTRLPIPPTINFLAKHMPLISFGPATVYYQEAIRLRALGLEKQVITGSWWLWFVWTLVLWFFGFQRYCARK